MYQSAHECIESIKSKPYGLYETLNHVITHYPHYMLNQIGGSIKSITIDSIEYFYNLSMSFDLNDESENTINVRIYQFEDKNPCVAFFIDKQNKSVIIEDLMHYDDCYRHNVKLRNRSLKGTGTIMMKIVIELCKTFGIKKIELSDRSYYRCTDGTSTINLSEGHTLSNGVPWYSTFGFLPLFDIDKDRYEYNKRVIERAKVKDMDWEKLIKKLIKLPHFKKKYNKLFESQIIPLIETNMNEKFSVFAKYLMYNYCELFSDMYLEMFNMLGLQQYSKKLMVLYL